MRPESPSREMTRYEYYVVSPDFQLMYNPDKGYFVPLSSALVSYSSEYVARCVAGRFRALVLRLKVHQTSKV